FSSFLLVTKGFIGTEFVSSGDRGEFIIRMELPKDATLEQTNFKARDVELYLGQFKEVEMVYTNVGNSSGMMGNQTSPYLAEISVKLSEDRDFTAPDFARELEIELQEKIAGVEFTAIPVSIMGTANEAPVQ